ncbi:MAG: hypothetical protein IJE10_10280 [Clostridia bacterium]|nr:hypothetical protein [Clostridia bacterium]
MKNIALTAPDWLLKNAIYQINPRTFSEEGTIDAVTKELPFLKELGFNIVYLCPVFSEDNSENKENWSKRQLSSETGNPKNMYRMNDYFEMDEEFGTMESLKALTERAHALGMKVLLDMVYAHIGPNAPIIKRHPEFVQQTPEGEFILTAWHFPALDFNCEGLREYLWCNMVYYISVIDADGFRLDVGDAIPVDFWKEARRRIQTIKSDAVLINEGNDYEKMAVAFDATYCYPWHEKMRNVFCDNAPADTIRVLHEELLQKIPQGGKLLMDIDNHDTVTDWDGRTETKAGHDGMEQIEVINFLMDGIPMVYTGNELACEAKLNMFANRFYMGKYEVTDRSKKHTPESIRRQTVIRALNRLKAESDVLRYGKTEWIKTDAPESVIAFKRVHGDKALYFFGNTKKEPVQIQIEKDMQDKDCLLSNGNHQIQDNNLCLKAREYVVFA